LFHPRRRNQATRPSAHGGVSGSRGSSDAGSTVAATEDGDNDDDDDEGYMGATVPHSHPELYPDTNSRNSTSAASGDGADDDTDEEDDDGDDDEAGGDAVGGGDDAAGGGGRGVPMDTDTDNAGAASLAPLAAAYAAVPIAADPAAEYTRRRLATIGFARDDVAAALSSGAGSVHDAVDWLCLHLDEDALPKGFEARKDFTTHSFGAGGGGGGGDDDPHSDLALRLTDHGYPRASALLASHMCITPHGRWHGGG
jgi:hypothetical protein